MKKKIRFLKDILLRYDPERVYLFGSWSRNEEDDLSDLDVVVIKRTKKTFFNRLSAVFFSRSELEEGPYSESPIFKKAMSEGIAE